MLLFHESEQWLVLHLFVRDESVNETIFKPSMTSYLLAGIWK